MRPGRDNIASPDLPLSLAWVGPEPQSMPMLTAKGPALVHFVEFAQLNSVRTLPYVNEWSRRYREAGLSVIGVQAPRFPFAAEPANVAAAVAAHDIEFPIAIDPRHDLWAAYGCEGWPSLFLWSLGGALTWYQFGEGEYGPTEEAIQEELREIDALRFLPAPMTPLRATDGQGVRVMPPTGEIFPGGSYRRPWTAGEDGDELRVPYAAGGAYATLEGEGEVGGELDGAPIEPFDIGTPGLYPLAEHPGHESHELVLRPGPGTRVWSLSFAPGVP